MNNNKTSNSADDSNTVIPIAPMYYSNASNVNGGNQDVLYLTGNTKVIEDNHIGRNIYINFVLVN